MSSEGAAAEGSTADVSAAPLLDKEGGEVGQTVGAGVEDSAVGSDESSSGPTDEVVVKEGKKGHQPDQVPELADEGGDGASVVFGMKGSLMEGFKKKAGDASARLKDKAETLKERSKERRAKMRADSSHVPREASADATQKDGAAPGGDSGVEVVKRTSLVESLQQKAEKASATLKERSQNRDLAEAIATPKDMAQKAVEATKKAAEDARRGAEETANRMKTAFQPRRTESSSSLPKMLLGNKLALKSDGDDSSEPKREMEAPLLTKDRVEGLKISSPSAAEVAEKTMGILTSPVKAGAAAVRTLERKLTKESEKDSKNAQSNSNVSLESPVLEVAASTNREVEEGQKKNHKAPTSESKDVAERTKPHFAHISKGTLVLGPFMEFAVRDSTILSVASFLVVWWTYKSIPMLIEKRAIPLITALSWTVMGFLAGFHWTLLSSRVTLLASSIQDSGTVIINERPISNSDEAALLRPATTTPGEDCHKLFNHTLRCVTSIRRVSYATPILAAPVAPQVPDRFWTCLHDNKERKKLTWEHSVSHCSENDLLHRWLLTFSDFRLKKKGSEWSGGSMTAVGERPAGGVVADTANAESSDGQSTKSVQPLGAVRMRNKSMVETLAEDLVIDPLCRLRGMDILQTDCAEEKIFERRLLSEMGLRKVPTLLVNVMTPWANILIYFQMPNWLKRFEDIEESEDDLEDTKALKRFLTADDEYRNQRLKVFPSLVDAPFAIRMMAPPKRAIKISSNSVPVSWHLQNQTNNGDGSSKAALIEVDFDLVTAKKVRKIASIVRPHTAGITLDCALVISKSNDSQNDEPSACLGMWRLDKVDLNGCAVLPPKTESEMTKEASEIMSTIQEETRPQEIAVAAG